MIQYLDFYDEMESQSKHHFSAQLQRLYYTNGLRIPFVSVTVAIIQLVVFYTMQSLNEDDEHEVPSFLVFDGQKKAQIWRFFTYGLVHSGDAHVLINTLALTLLAIPLEMAHNSLRILPLYFGSIAFAAAFVCQFHSDVILIGSSAAVYAFITSHATSILLNYRFIPGYGGIEMLLIATFFVCQFFTFDTMPVVYYKSSTLAHLGGCLAGLLMSPFLLIDCSQKLNPKIKYASIGTFGALSSIFCILLMLSSLW